jgi:hypothetical protein
LGTRTDSDITPRWRGIPQEAFAWREWNDEFVVMDLRGGDIHLLSTLAGMVLLELSVAESPQAVSQLARKLETSVVFADAEPAAAIEAVLTHFHRLGLAQPEST